MSPRARRWTQAGFGQNPPQTDTPPQAGFDRQDDGQEAEVDEEEPAPTRHRTWPRWNQTPARGPRGKRGAHRGSPKGWTHDSTEEELPPYMRWGVLVDADLSWIYGAMRTWVKSRATEMFNCSLTWRADRHSAKEHEFDRIPYRVSVRGENAQMAMQWFLDWACHEQFVDPEDIWSVPIPETDHQEQVESQVLASFYKRGP